MVPDFKISSETDLQQLRNRDLDASLTDLEQAFRNEKERQDRLIKIKRIQRFQQRILLHKESKQKLQAEIDNP
jgi:hypothetical protein